MLFFQTVYKHRDILQEIGDLIFSLIAEAGGADFSHWEPLFGRDPLHTLRLIRYPKRTEQIPKGAMLPDGRSEFRHKRNMLLNSHDLLTG